MGKTAVFEGEYSLSKILDLEEEVLKNSNQRHIEGRDWRKKYCVNFMIKNKPLHLYNLFPPKQW